MNANYSPTEQIAALRSRIVALQRERGALMAQPRSRAEVLRIAEAMVHHWHAQGIESFSRELLRAASGATPDLFSVRSNAVASGQPGAAPLTLDLGPLLVALLGADVVRKLIAHAAEQVPVGVEAKTRPVRLTKLAAELDALEREEERLLVLADAQGEMIDRRPDARPEIVLAMVGGIQ